MSDFPRIELALAKARHGRLLPTDQIARDQDAIDRAVNAFDQLSDRLVMDATNASVIIGNLRAEIAALKHPSPTP